MTPVPAGKAPWGPPPPNPRSSPEGPDAAKRQAPGPERPQETAAGPAGPERHQGPRPQAPGDPV